MKINKIVLYNFNSYEGMNEFDFVSEDENRNIVLIGGKNGAGKTSLFTAIKLALYGPLAYGYAGVNPRYISKIKECINSKAFQKDIVEAEVRIYISLMVEREIIEYEITRKWDYTKQKLAEEYYVKKEGELLNESELSYFQNYLQGMVPPALFEFFLFDGEEVGNIFSSSAYNSYIRKAIYTLCDLDIFEIIRKYTEGYVGKKTDIEEKEVYSQYEFLQKKVKELNCEKERLKEQNEINIEALEQVDSQLIELESVFKNAGGITEDEKQELERQFSEAEHIKSEASTKIKMFVEGLMPFFILRDFSSKISNQLDLEEKEAVFRLVQQKLKKDELKNILNEKSAVDDDTVDRLLEFLLEKFKPSGFSENTKVIHDLSKQEIQRIKTIISSIDGFDIDEMINLLEKKKAAAERTVEINRMLKSAMSDEDAASFVKKENDLLRKKTEINTRIHSAQTRINKIEDELTQVEPQKERAFENLKANVQNRNVLRLSSGLSKIMDSMLANKSKTIKKKLELLIVKNLHRIYRKNNLITHIEIKEDFQFNLYQNANYTTTELLHLIKNLGKEVFSNEIGLQSILYLYKKYKVTSVTKLQHVLEKTDKMEELALFKRIDINRLSKGERQIFILSLYWAIIEISGRDIPFVIDTPYARIDANHRKEISEKFFPNISKQVIILSTDEEINEEYYKIIKPYIAKEYLLINDESQNRTTVEEHYFFGE